MQQPYSTQLRGSPQMLLSTQSRLPERKHAVQLKRTGNVVEANNHQPSVEELEANMRKTVPVSALMVKANCRIHLVTVVCSMRRTRSLTGCIKRVRGRGLGLRHLYPEGHSS